MIAPQFDAMAQDYDFDGVSFAKFNCGSDPDNKIYAVGAGIKALPTFHLYQGSEKVGEVTGARAKELKELVKRHLHRAESAGPHHHRGL